MSKKALHISQKKNVIRFFLFLCFLLLIAMIVMTFSTKSLAYADSADDLTFAEIAREKKYLGGADEGELKVLTALPALKNKKTKNEDADEGF